MSSSSALVIAVAAALGRVGEHRRARPSGSTTSAHQLDAAGYYACIENGRSFAALDGDAGVGTHGGSEDHAAIVEGRAGHVSAFAFVPARALGAAPVPRGLAFRAGAVRRDRQQDRARAREPYNRLSAEAAELLEKWNRSGGRAISLGAVIQSGPQATGAPLSAGRSAAEAPAITSSGRTRGSRQRSRPWRRPMREVLGRLSDESQSDAEQLLGNQIPETSALARAARKAGAFAACSFGAGFGGSVWALVETERAAKFAHTWHPTAFVITPGPPLTQL